MRLRRTVLCTLTFFLPLLMLSAQTAAPGPVITGATARVTNLDLASGTYTVAIANNSSKEITAFVIAYSCIYSDGQTIDGESYEDWGATKWANHKTLQPGNTHTQTYYLQERKPAGVTDVKVDLILVAYADLTAEVRPGAAGERTFDDLRATRSAQARALVKSAQVITSALAAPDDSPVATALQTITSLRDDTQRSHSSEVHLGYLNDTIKWLQALPRGSGERAYLTLLQKDLQARAELLSKYAQLRRLR